MKTAINHRFMAFDADTFIVTVNRIFHMTRTAFTHHEANPLKTYMIIQPSFQWKKAWRSLFVKKDASSE